MVGEIIPEWWATSSGISSQFLDKHSATSNAQPQVSSSAPAMELQPKPVRVRIPQRIEYSKWQKICFESSDGTSICRTTMTGTDDDDQVVVRADLIQRADGPARLQLFVPQGANLQRGVKVATDQGRPAQIPFTYCLTNICIAAAPVDANLLTELESGKTLRLELADLNSSPVPLTLSLDQFAAARKGVPAQTFDFGPDEE
jgi:invasion protein IalB